MLLGIDICLARDFGADAPNEKWLGDILGIWTDEGWLYLAALLDTYSRFTVGWAMSIYRDEVLVTDALRMALARRDLPPNRCLIQRSDRGSQSTADDYLALLKNTGIQVSMSGKSDPCDNAVMESFFSTVRAELPDLERFPPGWLLERRCSSSLRCLIIVSAYIRLWATATPQTLKPPIYLETVSCAPSTKSGQDQIFPNAFLGVVSIS